MIFSKRSIRTTSIPKIWKIRSSIWKLKAIKRQNCQFWPKNGQILATNSQILVISGFSQLRHYGFLKKDHNDSFHTKKYKNLYRRLEDICQKYSKMAIMTPVLLPKFSNLIFWPPEKILLPPPRIFSQNFHFGVFF